ncbi:MAG: 50S ribosomal protein L9 [uncultured bacterium (gcode 4)]|uniref:Large ribosomal subunit protein bL9 n=1 Tax=uncultured bacterium (gcode 4) TaxID=1234023 RepID=K2GYV4_9BACT|nr:MAG: 50S ribosomal protein L9 [uncultured bacterium (gcode 4)]
MATDKLKVIMLQRLAWVGKQWEIIDVSYSQAKNYLIPKWFAKLVTAQEVEKLENKKETQLKNTRENVYNRHKIAESLHWKELVFEAKWSWDKIFGWIQEQDIAEKLNKEFGCKLEKKNIIMPDKHHIKKAWKYDIKLNLWSDVYAKIVLDLKVTK